MTASLTNNTGNAQVDARVGRLSRATMSSPRRRRRYAYRCMHTIQSMELLYTFCLGAIITAAQHLSRLPEDYNIMHYAVGVVTRIVIAWCTMTLLGLWYGFSQLRDLRTKKVLFLFIFGKGNR